MADPNITNGHRVVAIQHKRSGLPEDVFVNAFAFRWVGDGAHDYMDLGPPFSDLYSELGSQFAPSSLVESAMELRCYNLMDPVPRPPWILDTVNRVTSSGDALPEEVAITLSFYSGRNLPRRRGRLYLGPWARGIAATIEGQVRVHAQSIDPILQAFGKFHEACLLAGWQWSILSGVDREMHPVTHVWMDNAFDTQRRRGGAATSRLTHTLAEWPPESP